jgi:quercetin dioxygenase-like cupin family protein
MDVARCLGDARTGTAQPYRRSGQIRAYTLRLKFPKGFKIAPHTHPDSREVTVLSGVFATGYGESFDGAKLKILPAGSFYTELANVPHYIEIEEDTVLQVSGKGPSGRNFVNRSDNPK